jgi:hypothetical protein
MQVLQPDTRTEKLLAGVIGWVIGYVFGLLYVANVVEPLSGGLFK